MVSKICSRYSNSKPWKAPITWPLTAIWLLRTPSPNGFVVSSYQVLLTDLSLFPTLAILDAEVDNLSLEKQTFLSNMRIIFFFLFLVSQSLAFGILWLPLQSQIAAEISLARHFNCYMPPDVLSNTKKVRTAVKANLEGILKQ